MLAGLRSVLCAPILCDHEVVACFYVTHHEVDDLFGDIEVQLAEFIATVAGAALEHVAGSEARFRSLVHNSSDVITIVGRRREGDVPELLDRARLRLPAVRGAGPRASDAGCTPRRLRSLPRLPRGSVRSAPTAPRS